MALPQTVPFQPQFNYPNNKLYQYEAYPILLSCNFVVDSTNGNGLGIRNLKGTGIANVFMNTSATAAAGNYGVLNPNPQAGMVLVQFQNQFNRYLSGFYGFASPLSGTSLTSVTQHNAYTIVSLGTASLAQWQAKGFPVGMVPAVGASFIATATGTIGGSATVEVPSVSGISSIEVVGDPNQTLQNSNIYQYGGAQMVMQCLGPTSSGVTTQVPTAPANGTVIGLNFYLSNSSIAVNGQ
jgi:hypothetical protein